MTSLYARRLAKGFSLSYEVLEHVVGEPGVSAVRSLLLEYQAALGIDLCFQDFARELDGLPGEYAPPLGRLYVAWVEGDAAACIGMRPLDAQTAEMKRLFVRSSHRGRGLGRRLAQQVIEDARSLSYRRLVLDTLPGMHEAQSLYADLGFHDIAAYTANPIVGARFLELTL